MFTGGWKSHNDTHKILLFVIEVYLDYCRYKCPYNTNTSIDLPTVPCYIRSKETLHRSFLI